MNLKNIILGCTLTAITSAANATVIDFIGLANGSVYGESGYSTLSVGIMSATGTKAGASAYAYLDSDAQADGGGLGVCGLVADPGMQGSNTSNKCTLDGSHDDNVTVRESLSLTFSSDVTIKNIWFNNNHDGGFQSGDKIDIDGSWFDATYGLAGDANAYSQWWLSAGDTFDISFVNTQFYVSAIEFETGFRTRTVPEPAILGLLALGLIGLGATKRRKQA